MKKDKLYTVSKYSADRINKEAKANLFYPGGFLLNDPQILEIYKKINGNSYSPPNYNYGLLNGPDYTYNFQTAQNVGNIAPYNSQANYFGSFGVSNLDLGTSPYKAPAFLNPTIDSGFKEDLSKWQQNNPMGGQQMPAGNGWMALAQAAPGIAMGVGAAFKKNPEYSADAAGNGFGIVDKFLARGNKSQIGMGGVNVGASLMNSGLKNGNAGLILAGGIAGTVGTAINAGWGINENEKNIKALKENNARLQATGRQLASATTSDSFIQAAANMGNGTGFRGKDLVTGGYFAGGKAAREANKYLNAEKQALAYQGHAMAQGAQNVDKIQDDNVKANFAAGGGWLNYGDMGALEYGLALDAINARKRNAEIKDRIPNNPFGALASAPFNEYVDGGILFSDGGPLIKKENRGKFTAQAKAAGMGTQQFASHVLANKEDYSPTTVKRANFAHVFGGRNYNYGGPIFNNENLFDIGGVLQSHGSDWSNGSSHIDEGGTHEENPYQGVQVGVDPEGTPNLVEEGEIIYNDYVYSQRIELDDEAKEKFHFSKKRDITYADAAKKLEKEISERPNDPLSKAAFKSQMQDLAEEQERQKAEMQAEEAREQFESLSPEEQVAVMQNAEAQEQQAVEEEAMMQEQAAQEQAMQEQAAMQGQPTEEQMMQEQMMAQQQGMMPQQPMGLEAQMGGYAYGGLMGNQYGLGGNLFFTGGDKGEAYNPDLVVLEDQVAKWMEKHYLNTVKKEMIPAVSKVFAGIMMHNKNMYFRKPLGSLKSGMGTWDIEKAVRDLGSSSSNSEKEVLRRAQVLMKSGLSPELTYEVLRDNISRVSNRGRMIVKGNPEITEGRLRLAILGGLDSEGNYNNPAIKVSSEQQNSSIKAEIQSKNVKSTMGTVQKVPGKNYTQKQLDKAREAWKYLEDNLTPEEYEYISKGGEGFEDAKSVITEFVAGKRSKEGLLAARPALKQRQASAASNAPDTLSLSASDLQDVPTGSYNNTGAYMPSNAGNYAPTNYGTASNGYSQTPAARQTTMPNMPPVIQVDYGGQPLYINTVTGTVMSPEQVAAVQQQGTAASTASTQAKVPTVPEPDGSVLGLFKTLGYKTIQDAEKAGWRPSDFGNYSSWSDINEDSKLSDSFKWIDEYNNRLSSPAAKAAASLGWTPLSERAKRKWYEGDAGNDIGWSQSYDIDNLNAEQFKNYADRYKNSIGWAVENGLLKAPEGNDTIAMKDIVEAMKQSPAWQNTDKWLYDDIANQAEYLGMARGLNPDDDQKFIDRWSPYGSFSKDGKNWKYTLRDNLTDKEKKDFTDLFRRVRSDNKIGVMYNNFSDPDNKTRRYLLDKDGNPSILLDDDLSNYEQVGGPYIWGDPDNNINNTALFYQAKADAKAKKDADKTGDAAKKGEPTRNVVPVTKSEWPRYVGLFGPAVGLGMMAAGIGKPSLKDYEAALEIANGGASLASYMPIGNYLKYQPMDIWAQQNRMDANSRATDRAILNNASPVGTRNAGLLANSYNSQLGSGELYRNALQYNDQLMQGVGTFNRATDMFNAEAFNKASAINAEIRNRDRQLRAQIGLQTAAEKAAANAGWYNSLYGNVAGLFKGFSDLGRENAQRNMIAKLAASGAFGTLTPENAVGAELVEWADEANKKKKKNWLSIFG